MKPAAELAAVLATLHPAAVDRTFARRVLLADLLGINTAVPATALNLMVRNPKFLWTSGGPFRYNPPGLETLYLGEGESVAGAEWKQHPGLAGFDEEPAAPCTVFHVAVKGNGFLDLTDPGVQAALGTSDAELLAPWLLLSPNAPTQVLGKAVFDSKRFEGIRYRSAVMDQVKEDGFCVGLFKDRKSPGSTVHLFDPNGTWSGQW